MGHHAAAAHHFTPQHALKNGALGTRIEWQLAGNHITLLQDGSPIEMAQLSEEDAVNLAGRIVAAYHARYRDPEVNFHGTALHQVRDAQGQEWLVIDSNAHPADPFNRACAETTAMWQAKKLTNEKNPMIERSFLMGSYVDQPPSPEHLHASPCGHCRVELKARSNGDSLFYALPSLSPDAMEHTHLSLKAMGSAHDHPLHQTVYRAKMTDLLPLSHVRLPAEWLGQVASAEHDLAEGKLEWLELAVQAVDAGEPIVADSLEQVNQALVGAVARTHSKMGGDTESIRAVAVRLDDGRLYVMACPQDEGLPSKPPVVVAALMQACNQRNITDVYVMDYDPAQIRLAEADVAAGKPALIKAMTGGELDRIYKHRPKGQSVSIHILPFNDGTLTEQELKSAINSADISAHYPDAYVNPKSLSNGTSAGRG